MIDKDSLDELRLISGLFLSNPPPQISVLHTPIVKSLVFNAILDAISSSTDTEAAIKSIVASHPNLFGPLIEVIKKHYPENLTDVEKLAVLV